MAAEYEMSRDAAAEAGSVHGAGHASGASGSGCGPCEVPCPVCGRAALVWLHGVVACPLERWQLDLRAESLSLDDLRQRLAGAYEVSPTLRQWTAPLSMSMRKGLDEPPLALAMPAPAAVQEHAGRGCQGSVRFSLEQAFGCTQLLARCQSCQLLQVIV